MTRRHVAFRALVLAALSALTAAPALHAQTFSVDFSHRSGPPLVKDKFGVYQTPFWFKDHPPGGGDMARLLQEAGVRDLRYEMGWGKPDTYAFDQVRGTAADLHIDFRPLDPFLDQLRRAQVAPLFAMTYDPLPLKTGTDWQRWKDVPSDLNAWGEINRRYAAHYLQAKGVRDIRYEVWNEPDLPGDGGKVFFQGTPQDYARVYAVAASGLRAGDADALVGGSAVAYDLGYVQPVLSLPLDFVSLHAYDNYPGQLANARRLVADRPDLPLFLTEYASYTGGGRTAPASRFPAAMRFFRDVRGMLEFPDLVKVYWAQWIDDDLGMVTSSLHRKALFNAYKIYQTLLPVDRSPVRPDGADGIGVLAAADDHAAGVVVWNETLSPKTVTLHLDRLPFPGGAAQVYRIDASHASYADDPAAEDLTVSERWSIPRAATQWTGLIPAQGVVFLRAVGTSPDSLLLPHPIGTFVRSRCWFPDRASNSIADFDPRTSIIRLGLSGPSPAVSQIGSVFDDPVPRLQVQVLRSGPFTRTGINSLFGLRVDYGSTRGGCRKSVLWHDGSYSPARTSRLPWGTKTATVDRAIFQRGLTTGAPFLLRLADVAPPDWNRRIILTPILQDRGDGSCVRIRLLPAPSAR